MFISAFPCVRCDGPCCLSLSPHWLNSFYLLPMEVTMSLGVLAYHYERWTDWWPALNGTQKTSKRLQWPYQLISPRLHNEKEREKLKLDFSLFWCIWQPFTLWSPENTAWFWEVWDGNSGKLWILGRAGDWAAFILFIQKGRVCLTAGKQRQVKEKYVSFTLSVENPFGFSFPHLWRGDKSWQPYGFSQIQHKSNVPDKDNDYS